MYFGGVNNANDDKASIKFLKPYLPYYICMDNLTGALKFEFDLLGAFPEPTEDSSRLRTVRLEAARCNLGIQC